MIFAKSFNSDRLDFLTKEYNKWISGGYKNDKLFMSYEDNLPELIIIQCVKELSKTQHFLTVFFKIKEK